jgi:hypothetical protein
VLARCAVLTLALGAVACGEQPSPRAVETTAASPAPSDDAAIPAAQAEAEAEAEAEATVRAFFAVKGRAEDPLRVQLAAQATFLTSPDVHPATAFESSRSERPSLVTQEHVDVELSDLRWRGDEILVDFEYDTTGVSYPMIGDEVQRDDPYTAKGYWDGTATLKESDGTWLINHFTTVRSGGGTS